MTEQQIIRKNKEIADEERIKAFRRLQRAKRAKRASQLGQLSGLDEEEVYADFRKAHKELGLRYTEYIDHAFYAVPDREREKKAGEILRIRQEEKEKEQQRIDEYAYARIEKQTGWSREHTLETVAEAQERTHCMPEEYYEFYFAKLTKQEQEQVCLYDFSQCLKERFDVDRKFTTLVANKALANEYFHDYIHRPWCINLGLSLEEFKRKFHAVSEIFINLCAVTEGSVSSFCG